ncbi:MAG TPA: hypothetical protein DIS76_00285 [Rhodospirillaceae bacterium]|nr:hypothetical protein [Rhodospirillaceae bacterium]
MKNTVVSKLLPIDSSPSAYSFNENYVLNLSVDSEIYDEFLHAGLEEEKIALSPLRDLKTQCPITFQLGECARKQVFEKLGAIYISNAGEFFTDGKDIRNFYLFIARIIGAIDPLYGALYDVKSKKPDDQRIAKVTISQTSGFAPMHTDGSWLANPPDAIGLLCLSPAMKGGENELIHTHQIREVLKNHSVEIFDILQRPFYRESASPGFEVSVADVEAAQLPVMEDRNGFCHIQYMRRWIEEGHVKVGKPLSDNQIAALDYLDQLLGDQNLIQEVPMKKFDMIFTNNHTILHTRKPFEDATDETQKRHMVRVWIKR